jgi:hypothetical protein
MVERGLLVLKKWVFRMGVNTALGRWVFRMGVGTALGRSVVRVLALGPKSRGITVQIRVMTRLAVLVPAKLSAAGREAR